MRILLIDDDEILVDVLQRTLGEKNYTFDAVFDGEQGWTYGSTYNYDLLIMDWSLPKLDGISLCRRFRAYGYQMPILLLTAHNSSQEKIIGLDAGADDYLCKPFNVEELGARIRALLRRSHANALPVLTWGDLQLDSRSCQVSYQGDLILLTAKEYQLLELFMSHRQEVFSIEEIMETLWSSVEYPSEATVRSHLRHLRRKLKQAGLSDDPIETLRGRGYCLKAFPKQISQIASNQLVLEEDYCLSPELSSKEEQHLAVLTKAWQKYAHQSHQQLTILQETLQAWQQGQLTLQKREEASLVAHKLAGTVGIFGFYEGSLLARELEELLQDHSTEERGQISQFQAILNALRLELTADENLSQVISGSSAEDAPLLLIINDDQKFTQLLHRKALLEGMQTLFFSSPKPGKSWLQTRKNHQLPDIALIRLSFSEKVAPLEDYLSLIDELNRLNLSVPIIVISDRDRFEDRLFLAQRGVTFFVKQPITPEKAIDLCQKGLERSFQGKKVMIVDNDVDFLRLFPSLLEPWGFIITTLDDPRQFWDVLQAVEPDLLILKIKMPYLSGIELCKVLRTDPDWYKLPILYLSSEQNEVSQEEGFASGGDELLLKTLNSEQIAHRIIYHLDRHKG